MSFFIELFTTKMAMGGLKQLLVASGLLFFLFTMVGFAACTIFYFSHKQTLIKKILFDQSIPSDYRFLFYTNRRGILATAQMFLSYYVFKRKEICTYYGKYINWSALTRSEKAMAAIIVTFLIAAIPLMLVSFASAFYLKYTTCLELPQGCSVKTYFLHLMEK